LGGALKRRNGVLLNTIRDADGPVGPEGKSSGKNDLGRTKRKPGHGAGNTSFAR